MRIAVTGGLGTGKSTVSKVLAATLQCELLDTDQLCRSQLEPAAEGYKEFVRLFGSTFLQEDGTINRLKLRNEVFGNSEFKKSLEGILHPIVRQQVSAHYLNRSVSPKKVLVVEVPLLYEVGWEGDFDLCVVAYVPETTIIKRVMSRDGLSAEEIELVLKAQMSIEKKLEYGHYIVDNSGTFVSTVQQIGWLVRKILWD